MFRNTTAPMLAFNSMQFNTPQNPGNNWPSNAQGVMSSMPETVTGLTVVRDSATAGHVVMDNGYLLLGSTVPQAQKSCFLESTRGGYNRQDVTIANTSQASHTSMLSMSLKDAGTCSYAQ